jgi:hypothetical protein
LAAVTQVRPAFLPRIDAWRIDREDHHADAAAEHSLELTRDR